ncbi:uncharacterized protein LOC134683883 isoform X3 [Mytilus trossulus]|uniref:uncharacterized protein LOC134683883 isoform X3 n=1 Tax=Mytilus trossulus TaxID=6551 RepID=UPI003006E780
MNWILTLVLYVVSGTCHDTGNPPRSEDISIVYRSEKKEMIQVAIWKAFPKPTCHIFVGNSRIEESYEATYERVSVFYKVTFCFSYEALSKYCDNVLLITCFIGKTAFNYTRGIPIDCKETGKSPHATSEWLFMLLIIPGIIVLLTLVFLFNRRKTGILCWNVDGNSSENVPRLNETLLAKTSLLNNPDLKEAAS